MYQTSHLAGLSHRPRLMLLWKTGSEMQLEAWVFFIKKKKEADVRGKEIGWTDRFFFLGKIFVISNNLGKVKLNFCMSKTLFRSTSFWNFVSSSYSFKLHYLLKLLHFIYLLSMCVRAHAWACVFTNECGGWILTSMLFLRCCPP